VNQDAPYRYGSWSEAQEPVNLLQAEVQMTELFGEQNPWTLLPL